MKKTLVYILCSIISIHTFTQQDAKAKAILKQVSAKYRTYTSVKTDFTVLVDNPQVGAKQTQTGTLITQIKTSKFKVTLFDAGSKTAVNQEIISDGKTQWTYVPKDKEVSVNDANKGDDEMNPAKLFTMYEQGYKYIYTGDQKLNGKLCQVVDLSPEDANKPFFKIRLMIDRAKAQLYSATLFDKSGGKYTYTLNTFTPNVKVSDTDFTWDKKLHPGIGVVDLR